MRALPVGGERLFLRNSRCFPWLSGELSVAAVVCRPRSFFWLGEFGRDPVIEVRPGFSDLPTVFRYEVGWGWGAD